MALTFVFSIAGQLFSFFFNLIVGQILGNLSCPIIEELKLAWGLRDDICRLKNTVLSVRAVLLDAQEFELQSNSHQLNDWLRKLKGAFHRAKDVLEEFKIYALHYKASNKSILTKVLREFSRWNRIVFRFVMAHKIKMIRDEFDEIAANRSKFNLVERANQSVVIRKTTHSFVRDEDVIGREDEILLTNGRLNKKPGKKCLYPAFISATGDDVALESPKDLVEQYQLSEISEDHPLDESAESSVTMDPHLLVSSQESTGLSDLTPSYATTTTIHVVAVNSAVCNKSVETENAGDNTWIVAEERDLLVNHLRRVQSEVMNSTGINICSSNSVDKLIDVVIEGILGLPDEEDQFEKLFAMKCKALLLIFLLLFLAVMGMVYVFCSGEQSSYRGPLPT